MVFDQSLEQEQISLGSEMGFLPGSNQGCFDGHFMDSELNELSESPSAPVPVPASASALYTDVNVVPEHERVALEQMILNLEGEIMGLRSKQRSLDEKRREALNKILDIKGNIRVFCRVRPFLSVNKRRIQEPVCVGSDKVVVKSVGVKKEFAFDKVFSQEASQEDVFVEVEPIIRSALDGHNVCVIAYGQTCTGKTFTMEGTNEQPGIVPRVLEELFCQASRDSSVSFTFSMSILEVYMGNLKDLLAHKPSSRLHHESVSKCNLNIQTNPNGSVEIERLTDVGITDYKQASWWYAKGRRARATSWTNVNEASSRSHCLTRITIGRTGGVEDHKADVSKLWMVDLGGSERVLKTGATGQTLDEGKAINLSLSALGDVIAALKRKRGHVPYRNSKLTQILKDSLGDGSKALMLVHVSPQIEDVGETTCSLNFAKRVRAVESNRELVEEVKKHHEKRIAKLEQEMRDAEEECQKVKNKIQKAEFLLHENKKLFSTKYDLHEDLNETTPSITQEEIKEVAETPRAMEKEVRRISSNSLPRFMTSTMASRQRVCSADGDVTAKARSLRSVTRSSIQFSSSQSLSYSDPHFRAILRSSNRKSRYAEPHKPNTHVPEFPHCNGLESKPVSTPRNQLITNSYPNLRHTPFSHHRRRMSDIV